VPSTYAQRRKGRDDSAAAYLRGSQLGGRDSAGGGTVAAFSAKTRNAPPLTSEEYHAELKKGKLPDVQRGSKTTYRITHQATSAEGTTMRKLGSDYKSARKAGFSQDEARAQAISKAGSNAKLNRDAYGREIV
jgi:hypothetical protein